MKKKDSVFSIFLGTLGLGLLLFSQVGVSAQNQPLVKVAVGEARVSRSRVAFPAIQFKGGVRDPKNAMKRIQDIVTEDLAFSGLFDFISPAAFLEKSGDKKAGVKLGLFKFSDWSVIGAQFLIKSTGKVVGKKINMEVYLYAVQSGKRLLSKTYSARTRAVRKLAHSISNDIFHALTGRRGPFTTKVAFVSDVTGKKEIYIMDYDGHNRVQVTNRKTIAMAPSWSPDGKKLIFSSVTANKKNVRNHNLYTYNLRSGKIRLISNRKGLNSGANYGPNGKEVVLTMSFLGNPEIFILNPRSKVAKRITHSYGLDVDPSWSPDGRELLFVSDRSSRPMVYKMKRDGSNITRLTMAGQYNATPNWSPEGDKIVFAGWDKGKFDIFIMNLDGTNLERLTLKMGNNEDPHFAPDGYFIVYSSNRKGKKNLYITNVDNTIHRQITANFGNCEAPKWGPVL